MRIRFAGSRVTGTVSDNRHHREVYERERERLLKGGSRSSLTMPAGAPGQHPPERAGREGETFICHCLSNCHPTRNCLKHHSTSSPKPLGSRRYSARWYSPNTSTCRSRRFTRSTNAAYLGLPSADGCVTAGTRLSGGLRTRSSNGPAGGDETAKAALPGAAQPSKQTPPLHSTEFADRIPPERRAVTNFGALAIMAALPHTAPSRQLRLLLAVETFTPDSHGWRKVGSHKLMEVAGISYPTYKQARREVIEQRLAEYEPGNGSGYLSRWRLLIELLQVEGGNPPVEGGNPTPRKGGNPPPEKVVTQNAAASGNANAALGSSALGSSALSRGPAADTIRTAVPGVTDDEIEAFIAKITPKCRTGNIAAYVAKFAPTDIAAQIAANRKDTMTAARARPQPRPAGDIVAEVTTGFCRHDGVPSRCPSCRRAGTGPDPPGDEAPPTVEELPDGWLTYATADQPQPEGTRP